MRIFPMAITFVYIDQYIQKIGMWFKQTCEWNSPIFKVVGLIIVNGQNLGGFFHARMQIIFGKTLHTGRLQYECKVSNKWNV